jgi:hypothetical protein
MVTSIGRFIAAINPLSNFSMRPGAGRSKMLTFCYAKSQDKAILFVPARQVDPSYEECQREDRQPLQFSEMPVQGLSAAGVVQGWLDAPGQVSDAPESPCIALCSAHDCGHFRPLRGLQAIG